MTTGRLRAAASCCGALVLAVVVGLLSSPWHSGPEPFSFQLPSAQLAASALHEISGPDGTPSGIARTEVGRPAPAGLLHQIRHLTHPAITAGGAAGSPAIWWIAALALAMVTVLPGGHRSLRPQIGARQHGTRAPPLRS